MDAYSKVSGVRMMLSCFGCYEVKSESDFDRGRKEAVNRNGRQLYCKACCRVRRFASRYENMAARDLARRPICQTAYPKVGGWLWFNTSVSLAEIVAFYYKCGLSVERCWAALPSEPYQNVRKAWAKAYACRARRKTQGRMLHVASLEGEEREAFLREVIERKNREVM